MKLLVVTIFSLLLTLVIANPDALGAEKSTTSKKTDTKLPKPTQKYNYFVSTEDWRFSILLPQNWKMKGDFPFYFAGANVLGGQIVVDYAPAKRSFSDRNDFHSHLLSTEMNQNGFSLGNSITTVSTDYGYKSMVVLKFKKQDGNGIILQKDFHYIQDEAKIYSLYGYSHDADSYKLLKKTLDTFAPST